MKNQKTNIHILPAYFLNPTNPISVNLIGAGGTGSQILTALARMNFALLDSVHCGLNVTIFDPDTVEPSNLGRQLFNEHELGMNKAVALTNRVNRFFGTNWKAVAGKFEDCPKQANINITCVDTVSARKKIAGILNDTRALSNDRDKPLYWLDLGNGRNSGQVWLSTIEEIKQPESKKFNTISTLCDIFETYRGKMESQLENNAPSCSLAQALGKQDLFINSVLANMGASLLWSMFRLGALEQKGFFLNLTDFRSTPVPV
ncbi:PRTRC system ThiF family protein [Pedobacter cryotolerans]|uniref:PRTRC system ThiF family protein n=1 Tax=Pedobacter cryotolerans TaxID=2571270 RepID=A0A4U1C5C5_9SPHI|nr:PRTRC system ThiF family protein [Pedobacter cryotolerans]TKC01148.1 PRTRC system ThiF family protein [Pedobacter cryotolerans]